MPSNISGDGKRKRRREAWQSVLMQTILHSIAGMVILRLKEKYQVDGFWGALMLIGVLLEFVTLIPAWIVLRTRLKEIEGGEEDAAAQY